MATIGMRMIGSVPMNKKASNTRVFCIGRNYANHARELSNPVPDRPVIFMKPASSLVWPGSDVYFPAHGEDLQHEVELVVEIGKDGRAETVEDAKSYIRSYSIGVDLTLRDVQKELKARRLPWEIAKAFDQSALIGDLVRYEATNDLADVSFSCSVNGELRQTGYTKDMIFSVEQLLIAISGVWELQEGDIVYTGTPSGVGSLRIGDRLSVHCNPVGEFTWNIVAWGTPDSCRNGTST
jgi:2-keto-4-pentenoate hydratase/2-oxohepta-3-ene-1,7-dioic acid hydratase in catechol pathway